MFFVSCDFDVTAKKSSPNAKSCHETFALYFISKSIITLCVIYVRSLNHFELICVFGPRKRFNVIIFLCGYPVLPVLFVEIILFPLNGPGPVEKSLDYICDGLGF